MGQKQKQCCPVCGKNHKAKTKCQSLAGARAEAARLAKKAARNHARASTRQPKDRP